MNAALYHQVEQVLSEPCGPGVIGKSVIGTGGIGGGLVGGVAVPCATGGDGLIHNGGVVGSGIGGGVGAITTGPQPCGGLVYGDVDKTPVPCGDIYECGIVPSGGKVLSEPCGPGVIGKSVIGTGGIGGGLVGGVAVPCATGGDGLIHNGGVVGSGIGGGVGAITTGPQPCGGLVYGDATKTPVPCGDIYECGIVPSGGKVLSEPCGPGVIGKSVIGTGGIGGGLVGGVAVPCATGGDGLIHNGGVVGSGIGGGVGAITTGPQPCGGLVYGDVDKTPVPCGDIYECGIVPSGGAVLSEPCGPGVIGKSVIGTGGIGGGLVGGVAVPCATGGDGLIHNGGVVGSGIGGGVGAITTGPQPCGGLVYGDVDKTPVPCGDIYECGIVPSGGKVLSEPCGPGVIGKSVIGTGGIGGGLVGGVAVPCATGGDGLIHNGGVVGSGIGGGVGAITTGPQPCGGLVYGDVDKTPVPCGDIYECGIVPSGGKVLSEPCGPGVIGKSVIGTGGIGGGLVGGVAVPCATGGDGLIHNGGVVGSGIGGGVGAITTGLQPCGGLVYGDATKTPVPCGDIYECGIVPSGGKVLSEPCGPGVIGKSVIRTGGIGGGLVGGVAVPCATGGDGLIHNGGVVGSGIGGGVGAITTGPQPCGGLVYGDVDKTPVPCGDIYECGIVPSGGKVLSEPCGPGVIGKSVIGTGGIGGGLVGGVAVPCATGGDGLIHNGGVVGSGIGGGVGAITTGPQPCGGLVYGDVDKTPVPCGDIYECGIVPSGGKVLSEPCGPGVIGKSVIGTGGIGGGLVGGVAVPCATGGDGLIHNGGVVGSGIGGGVGAITTGPQPCGGLVYGDVDKTPVPCGDIYECGIVPSGGKVLSEPCGPGVIGKSVIGTGGIGGGLVGGVAVPCATGGDGLIHNGGVVGSGIGGGVGAITTGPQPCGGLVYGDVDKTPVPCGDIYECGIVPSGGKVLSEPCGPGVIGKSVIGTGGIGGGLVGGVAVPCATGGDGLIHNGGVVGSGIGGGVGAITTGPQPCGGLVYGDVDKTPVPCGDIYECGIVPSGGKVLSEPCGPGVIGKSVIGTGGIGGGLVGGVAVPCATGGDGLIHNGGVVGSGIGGGVGVITTGPQPCGGLVYGDVDKTPVPCGDIYECGIVPSGGAVLSEPCGPGVIGKSVIGTGGIGGGLVGGVAVPCATGGDGLIHNGGVVGSGIGGGVGVITTGPQPCGGLVYGDVDKTPVPCGDIYECGIVPSGGKVLSEPCGPGVIGKSVIGTGGIGGGLVGGVAVPCATGGDGLIHNGGVVGSGIGGGVGAITTGPQPCGGLVYGDVDKTPVPCGDIYECGIVPSGGKVLSEPCGPGVIGKSVIGTGGIGGGLVGGVAVPCATGGDGLIHNGGVVGSSIGGGVGAITTGPQPCGGLVYGDVDKTPVPCGDIYECGIVPSGGKVLSEPCGPGVIGKSVIGTGGIGGGLVGGVAVPCATGGDGLIHNGGVVGSGIGGGVGAITTGPQPCGGLVYGDVDKTPVPCGDIYECGIVPSGGKVLSEPCGPGVIGKSVIGTGGIGEGLVGGVAVPCATGGDGLIHNGGVVGSGIGGGVGAITTGPQPCGGLVYGDVDKTPVPCGDIYECGIVPSGGKVLSEPCGPGVIGKSVIGTGGIGGGLVGGVAVPCATGGDGLIHNGGVVGSGIGGGVGAITTGPQPCGGLVYGDVDKTPVPCGDIYECGIVPSGGKVLSEPCGPGVIGKSVIGTGGIGGGLVGGVAVPCATGGDGLIHNGGVVGSGIGGGVGAITTGPQPCGGLVYGDVDKTPVPCGDIYECGIVPSGGKVLSEPCGPGVIGKSVIGTGGIGGGLVGGVAVPCATGGDGLIHNGGVVGSGIGGGVGAITTGPQPCGGLVYGDVDKTPVPCGDIYECGIVPSGGKVLSEPCGPGVIGKSVIGTGGIGGGLVGGVAVPCATGGDGLIHNGGVVGSGIGGGVGAITTGPQPCGGLVYGDVDKTPVPCGDIYECGIVPSGGKVLSEPCGPGVIGKSVIGTGGIGGGLVGGVAVPCATGGDGLIHNGGVVGSGIGGGVGAITTGPQPCGGLVYGDVDKTPVPCGDIYECGIVPSGGKVLSEPCGPGVIGKSVIGTGGIGGGLVGGVAVPCATGGDGLIHNGGVVGSGIGGGVGAITTGPQPCGGLVYGDVDKTPVPCGDIYECGIVPSGGKVLSEPCGPGVIGKSVIGTGGIGGGLVGGVAVPCATGGDGLIHNGGVVGSGIGGGVGAITTGPQPCGGLVYGDATKTPVPCGDIYECGIVPSGGKVLSEPCGPGVIGKSVIGTGGIGGGLVGGVAVPCATGGDGLIHNGGVVGSGIGGGVGAITTGPQPCGGLVYGDVDKTPVPCGDIYECGIVPSGGKVLSEPCGPGVIGKSVIGTGGIGGGLVGGVAVPCATGGDGLIHNGGVVGSGIGGGVGAITTGPQPCGGLVYGDVDQNASAMRRHL